MLIQCYKGENEMNIRTVLMFFLLLPWLFASEPSMDDLLDQFRVENDLSKMTKQENQGHITVFTREDLERMHAYKLSDVLKTIKTFTYQNNHVGAPAMARFGSAAADSGMVRISINDHDIPAHYYGSAVSTWGDMDLTYIDHIVIYQGASAVSFGDEVGPVMVKMYTKTPERDNGNKATLRYSSYNSSEASFMHAYDGDKYQYLASGTILENNRKRYNYNGNELSRDYNGFNLFGSLSYSNTTIDIAGLSKKADSFFGAAVENTVGDNESKIQHYYITYTNHFLDDKSLKLILSADQSELKISEYTPIGFDLYDGQTINQLSHTHKENTFSANLSKEWSFDNHRLITGMQYKYKTYDVIDHTVDGVQTKALIVGPDSERIMTLFSDWEYMFNDKNMVSIALKMDQYERYHYNDKNYIGRLGYTSLFDEHWRLKLFLSKSYMNPSFKQMVTMAVPFQGNPELKPTEMDTVSGQLRYKDDKHTVWLKLVRKRMENGIMLNQAKKYVNSSMINYGNCYNVGYSFRFRTDDKLTFEYSKSTSSAPVIRSSDNGFFIRLFNRFGDFDLYNELIYRSSYSYSSLDIESGYDYNVGLNYQSDKDLKFSIKGENVLDDAIHTSSSPILPTMPAVDRRVIASMEYTF